MADEPTKPNFSQLAKELGCSRNTVAKHWHDIINGTPPKIPTKRHRRSKFDPYLDEIKHKFETTTSSGKALFKYLENKYGKEIFNSYNSFKYFLKARGLHELRKQAQKAHVRYETLEAEQIQLDWKEDIKLRLKDGSTLVFNLFNATLGYSRLVCLVYSRSRTTADFLRCLLEVIYRLGGLPSHFLTDNMAAIVSVTDKNHKHKLPIIRQFEKDIDTEIKLCKPRSPETKGKNESANRMANWFEPYQDDLESEEDLLKILPIVNRQINEEICRTTSEPRELRYKQEKEHLRPIPNGILLDSYIDEVSTKIVPNTLLVAYKGSEYSVPLRYIGKRVKIIPCGDEIYIYHNSEMIACHLISDQKINYRKSDYLEGLESAMTKRQLEKKGEKSIEKQALENLKNLEKLKHKK